VASRRGNRRKGLSRQREVVEKQETRWRTSEHTYRDKEQEERTEEDRSPLVYTTSLAGGGRGL
jgi:hypothetical protein